MRRPPIPFPGSAARAPRLVSWTDQRVTESERVVDAPSIVIVAK
jgi:hypothetical protein